MAKAALSLLPDPVTKSLRTRYRTLRVMSHSSGLAATYAFVSSKAARSGSKDAADYERIREVLATRLRDQKAVPVSATTPRDVMNAIAAMEPGQYLRASEDIEMLFAWLARLADAYVSDAAGAQPADQDEPDD